MRAEGLGSLCLTEVDVQGPKDDVDNSISNSRRFSIEPMNGDKCDNTFGKVTDSNCMALKC